MRWLVSLRVFQKSFSSPADISFLLMAARPCEGESCRAVELCGLSQGAGEGAAGLRGNRSMTLCSRREMEGVQGEQQPEP